MRSGFTLVEILVVLVLMGLAVALVAPALVPRRAAREGALATVVSRARDAAARRGETMHLTVEPSGTWRLVGAASSGAPPVAAGRLGEFDGPAFTLVASPIGTCAFDARSARAAERVALDLLTCELSPR